ncbi:S8 family serine peptidase [Mycobacterium sp. 1274756.6]|uniref:S8 family serine peptidase n=1 Tax=Mycobacterium sp. 1274756.6 TaxID=1834076 RepID=UPI0007FD00E0|nr:S8 family serine peptidase [Mycobacterium sp. 1274756.6]OBJ71901.1 peptidase S8 [Mycobacterium sp. 1274756.6]
MKRSGTGSRRVRRIAAATGSVLLVAAYPLAGSPAAHAIDRPAIDPNAAPADGPPGPEQEMRQTAYCVEGSVSPGTDFRVQPKFMNMLNLPEAWKFGRGGGVKVAVIDTGVTPHPRLPNLVGGGDYVMAGGDGLADCDAHGTMVASLIAAAPAGALAPLPPPRETRRPPSVPTTEAPPPPPPPPPPQTITLEIPTPVPVPQEEAPSEQDQQPGGPPQPGPPGPPAPPGNPGPAPGPAAAGARLGALTPGAYTGGARIVAVDRAEAPPLAPPGDADAFNGVAPDVELISIRQSSGAFAPKDAFGDEDPQVRQKVDNIRTMARAIVHAADLGARVINVSMVTCMDTRNMLNLPELGAAVHHAAIDKDAVIVVSAGDTTLRDCKQNPPHNPLQPNDPRDWNNVNTVVTPAWFDDLVLTVGAVNSDGVPLKELSVAGPWVSIAAPGTDIVGLSNRDDGLINAIDGPDNTQLVPAGPAYSTAIVSGVAALVRAKFPQLTAHQVIKRLTSTARPPAGGVDNQVGYGVVDPVAALTWDVPDGPARPPERLSAPLDLPPPETPRDMTPVWVAAAGLGAALVLAAAVLGGTAMVRRTGWRR